MKGKFALPVGYELLRGTSEGGCWLLHVRPTTEILACPKCNESATRIRPHGYRTTRCVDVPCGGQPVCLRLELRRYRCSACGSVLTQPAPGIHAPFRMTRRCTEFLLVNSISMPLRELAARLGCSRMTIKRIVDQLAPRCCDSRGPASDVGDHVSEAEVNLWLIAVPRIHPGPGLRRDSYVRGWNVPDKVRWAKRSGEWAAIRARGIAIAAEQRLLAYLVEM
ncbi:transposase family protein [Paraburkholderia tropica]|uniref:transposase family protein n=1 Tax=Paraburkholderia tropica TaxID=92647 RepID=UPI0038BCA4FF